jgi:hypothetical protein
MSCHALLVCSVLLLAILFAEYGNGAPYILVKGPGGPLIGLRTPQRYTLLWCVQGEMQGVAKYHHSVLPRPQQCSVQWGGWATAAATATCRYVILPKDFEKGYKANVKKTGDEFAFYQ